MSLKPVGHNEIRKCRLCLCDDKRLIYLFEGSGVFTDVAKAIMEVLQYEVFKDDVFPPYICIACSDKLWEFKAFKEKCDSAKESFESFLSKTERSLRNQEELLMEGDDQMPKNLQFCVRKDGDFIEKSEKHFQVFAESIAAVKSEAEDVNVEESNVDCFGKITVSPVEVEFQENERKEQEFPSEGGVLEGNTGMECFEQIVKEEPLFVGNSQESLTEVTALGYNASSALELVGCCIKNEPPTHVIQESNELVFGPVLRPKGERSYHLSQSDSENSEADQSSYKVSPDEMSSSDAEEETAPIESNEYWKTGNNVTIGGESLSKYPLIQDSESLASTSRNSTIVDGLSNGLRTAECSMDSSLVGSVPTKADLFRYGIQNQMEKSVVCEQCGKRLKNQRSLRQHTLGMHSSRELYQCKICEKSFKTAHRLYLHSLIHRETPKFSCSECGRGFQLKQYFMDHLRRHGLKLFECVHCGIDFRNKLKLVEHYPVHDGEVNWTCDTCGVKYRRWSDIVAHGTLHEVKMVFICDTCGVEYAKKGDLIRHTYKHTRPYACLTCGKRFPTKSVLRTHSYSHSEVKPHQCEICKKRFNQAVHLSEHLKTHSEERPYPCQVCSYRGKTKSLLKSHQLQHSTCKPYNCSFCDRTFASNKFKLRHERMSHVDKMANWGDANIKWQ